MFNFTPSIDYLCSCCCCFLFHCLFILFNQIEKTPHFKWANYSEQIAKKLWKASQQGGLNDDVVKRNIKHLEKFAAKSRNHLVCSLL